MLFVLYTILGLIVIVVVAAPIYFAWVAIDNVRAQLAAARAIKASARAIREANTPRDEKV